MSTFPAIIRNTYRYKQVSNQKRGGTRLAHRRIMEEFLGRKLERFEFVHHKNGDGRDNRLENLEVVTPKQHAIEHGYSKHPQEKCCEVCGARFVPPTTRRASQRTCSKKCRYALSSKTQRRPEAPHSRHRTS